MGKLQVNCMLDQLKPFITKCVFGLVFTNGGLLQFESIKLILIKNELMSDLYLKIFISKVIII